MGIRTDLALESAQAIQSDKAQTISGITQNEYEKAGCIVTQITVESEEAAKKLGKPIGEYTTIEMDAGGGLDSFSDDFEQQVELLAEEIRRISPPEGDVLVVGLGNDDITPDALGPLAAKQIFATRHIPKDVAGFEEFAGLRSVSSVAPGVLGQTGIEVAEITKAICKKVVPSVVVAIDALACSDVSRLGRTIQITNTGISPGSGVKNSRKELSQKTLKTSIVAIGVPTVVDMGTIAESISGTQAGTEKFSDMMVTPRSIDKLIEHSAKLIAMGINSAYQPDMSIEDFISLC